MQLLGSLAGGAETAGAAGAAGTAAGSAATAAGLTGGAEEAATAAQMGSLAGAAPQAMSLSPQLTALAQNLAKQGSKQGQVSQQNMSGQVGQPPVTQINPMAVMNAANTPISLTPAHVDTDKQITPATSSPNLSGPTNPNGFSLPTPAKPVNGSVAPPPPDVAPMSLSSSSEQTATATQLQDIDKNAQTAQAEAQRNANNDALAKPDPNGISTNLSLPQNPDIAAYYWANQQQGQGSQVKPIDTSKIDTGSYTPEGKLNWKQHPFMSPVTGVVNFLSDINSGHMGANQARQTAEAQHAALYPYELAEAQARPALAQQRADIASANEARREDSTMAHIASLTGQSANANERLINSEKNASANRELAQQRVDMMQKQLDEAKSYHATTEARKGSEDEDKKNLRLREDQQKQVDKIDKNMKDLQKEKGISWTTPQRKKEIEVALTQLQWQKDHIGEKDKNPELSKPAY